jgi:hypothetical protein
VHPIAFARTLAYFFCLSKMKYGEMGLKLGLDASHDTRETLEYVVMSAASDTRPDPMHCRANILVKKRMRHLVLVQWQRFLLEDLTKALPCNL